MLYRDELKSDGRTNPDERSDIGSKTALSHTFKDDYIAKYTTNNLMDYVDPGSFPPNGGSGWEGATDLVRAQWDMVHNPAIFTPLQSDGDGAYIPGIYFASHNPGVIDHEKTNSWYTYYAPSGLPFSLPKGATKLNHSGKLSEYPSKDFIVLPNKCLTSFELDGQIYVAIATKQEFLGYLPFLSLDETKALKDNHSIPNLNVLKLYDLATNTQEAIKYLSLEGFSGDYYAKGPLPINDGGVLRCSRCQMVIDECYCGRACICYAHEPNKYGNYGDRCNQNRIFAIVGIPFIDLNGHITKIEKLFKTEELTTKSALLHNQMLDSKGRMMFLTKIGAAPLELSFENEITGMGYILDVMKLSVTDQVTKNLIDNLQFWYNKFDLYNTASNAYEAIENEEFAKAFYEGIKLIPAIDAIFDGIEMGLSFVYSEQVMNALYVSSKQQLSDLYLLPESEYKQKRVTELERFMKISSDQLDRIKEEKFDNLHTRVCTCP